MNIRLSKKDWQLLSEYLDGQLSQRERERLESRLSTQPDLKQAFQDLQQMRAVLRRAPRRRVPHSFVLTPAMAVKPNPFARWVPALSLSSALATLILVVTIVFRPSPTAIPIANLTIADEAAILMEAPAAAQNSETGVPIILWGGVENYSAHVEGIGGRGGGGGGGGDLGAADSSVPAPMAPPEMSLQSAPDAGKDFPPAATAGEAPVAEATPAPTESVETAEAAEMAQPSTVEGSGPILGIAPKEAQGEIRAEQPAVQRSVQAPVEAEPRYPWLTAAQIALALTALAAGASALIFYLRSRRQG